MSGVKVLGLVLLVAGLAALAYGGFEYTRSKRDVELGPIEFEVKKTERVQIPPWAGVAAAATGAALLVFGGRKR
jgi:hypothetical protein